MTALAPTEDEQRQMWRDYLERLRGLEGAEYDRAEQEAWEALQAALRPDANQPRRADDSLG